MSTADGQAVLGVIDTGVHVFVCVCDPSQVIEVDSAKRGDSRTRMFRVGELVDMATFANTAVDGAAHHLARRCDEGGQAGDRSQCPRGDHPFRCTVSVEDGRAHPTVSTGSRGSRQDQR